MIRIITSGFTEGFPEDFAKALHTYIKEGSKLAFVASEFEKRYETTDRYCRLFMKMFIDQGITFQSVTVVDGRMSPKEAQDTVKNADVIWLSGGDTPTEFSYFQKYGLIPVIQQHKGVVIGMSAGSINMTKTAICTLTCGHDKQEIYEGLGLVDFSVEPHLDKENILEELLHLSETYPIYGICDNGAIICDNEDKIQYIGEVYLLKDRKAVRI
ncbi:MAG: hypothetical protein E7256_05795 [Lachnospiraceae bacterium]|nr:hypothetical protein [Lachnospiraceae bacterium]